MTDIESITERGLEKLRGYVIKEPSNESWKEAEDVEGDERRAQESEVVKDIAEDFVPPEDDCANGFEIRHRVEARKREQARERAEAEREREAAERAASQAVGGDPVVPYNARVCLLNGQAFDLNTIIIPWADWLKRLNMWHGIAWDGGYVPLSSIAVVFPLQPGVEPPALGGNVVAFPGKK